MSSIESTLDSINPTLNESNNDDEDDYLSIDSSMSYKPSELTKISRHLSQSPTQTAQQKYEDLVVCSVCYDAFDGVNQMKLPKILPCQHIYCVDCITNVLKRSMGGSCFDCPQCKFKVESLHDPFQLPTSRIILTLLEKEISNYCGFASCPNCRQMRNLEVCFECNLPLCVQCIGKHFDVWKSEINEDCLRIEQNLDGQKRIIDQINPLIIRNYETIQQIKEDVESTFNMIIQRLNASKQELMESLDEIKQDNTKYVNMKQEVASLIAKFKLFREKNDNYDKNSMSARIKNCQQNYEQALKLEKEFALLGKSKFKLIEKFTKIKQAERNVIGDLIVSEVSFEPPKAAAPAPPPPPQLPPPIPPAPTQKPSAPPIANAELQKTTSCVSVSMGALNLNPNDDLAKWASSSQMKPHFEITSPIMANHIAAYNNLLFGTDSSSNFYVYEKAFSHELVAKHSFKLNVPNVKSIAVNNVYLALAYTTLGLKKEQLKSSYKNLPTNGVLLFRRDDHIVCSVYEKLVDLSKLSSFSSLGSIALHEKFLFVSDRDTRKAFKLDIRNGSLLKQIDLNGELGAMSVNSNCLCVNDVTNSTLYLIDVEKFELIKSCSLKTIDLANGALSLYLTEHNSVFVKNSDTQLTLLDAHFQIVAHFNEIPLKIQNLALLKDGNNQMLIVGCLNAQRQFKFLGYKI